jgi:hypothetical protein
VQWNLEIDLGVIISALVAVGAYLGWQDSRKRTDELARRTAVKFRIEDDGNDGWFKLRNVGDQKVLFPTIDGNSLKGFELGGATMYVSLLPNESMGFTVKNSDGVRPDTLQVTWTGPFKGAETVVFPSDSPGNG